MKDYFKYCSLITLRYILNIFNIFPIKRNRIVFYSFNGKQYSCNPRKISEFLQNDDGIEIIWAFKNPDKFRAIVPQNIRCVKYRSLRYYYYAKTARVIVQNVQGAGELSRRKGQTVIQTWHASNGYKQQGRSAGIRRKLQLLYHRDYSYVMSGAESMTERRIRGTMGFSGPVIPGTPRMDAIINNNNEEKTAAVYKSLGIDRSKKIMLYAPTWRADRSANDYGLDYTRLMHALEKRFGGSWVIAVRLHPNVYSRPDVNLPYVLDVTDYPDMEELLCAAEMLISDYSSCIWDYSFRYKPCFLFCTDIDTYGHDRNFDIPIEKWRFPIAQNNDELEKLITDYDENEFTERMKLHHSDMGNLEDGHATERVCAVIKKTIFLK